MSRGFWPQNIECVADHCGGMYRVGCPFDKSAHLFVDLPAMKAIFSGIQADLSFTPQISSADSSNSRSVMPGYIHPRNIQGLDRDNRHSFPIERVHVLQNSRMLDFRKKLNELPSKK